VIPPAFALALYFLLSSSGPLEGYKELDAPTGKLFWRGWSEEDRLQVIKELPQVLATVERRLQATLESPFTTVLVPGHFELRRMVEQMSGKLPDSQWVLGVALPAARVLVIRGDVPLGWGTFHATLTHEVAHLVLHRRLSSRIPRWFDEGVATWLSGAQLTSDDEAYLALLARVGGLYLLEDLESSFPGGHLPTSTAYRQSHYFITYLVERHGSEAVPRLFRDFESGKSVDGALQGLTGVSLTDLERAFEGWAASRRSLVAAMASVVSIWTVAALLAVLAIARYSLRRRKRLLELGGDEAGSS
jgi:hypothetical protein